MLKLNLCSKKCHFDVILVPFSLIFIADKTNAINREPFLKGSNPITVRTDSRHIFSAQIFATISQGTQLRYRFAPYTFGLFLHYGAHDDLFVFKCAELLLKCSHLILKPNLIVKNTGRSFSRPMANFPALFKANLVFKYFQDSPSFSSTFQACANPVIRIKYATAFANCSF